MKLQRYINSAVNADYAGNYDILADDGPVCLASDVEALEAENAALHAECDRLTAMLTAMLGPQKPMSAEEVTVPGFYLVRADNTNPWVPCVVARFNARSEGLRMLLAGKSEELPVIGELTPIKMPEV